VRHSQIPSRKVVPLPIGGLTATESIEDWAGRYLDAAVRGVRSSEVADKIALHLARPADHFTAAHGHEHLTAVFRREVITWRTQPVQQGVRFMCHRIPWLSTRRSPRCEVIGALDRTGQFSYVSRPAG
jgi:hypothetical protein